MILQIGVILMILKVLNAQTSDYCSITKKHTMCQYQGYGPKCGQVLGSGITRQVKIHILSKNSHIENPNFYKIHISEVSFFIKFTILKSQFSQNSHFFKRQILGDFWIKS